MVTQEDHLSWSRHCNWTTMWLKELISYQVVSEAGKTRYIILSLQYRWKIQPHILSELVLILENERNKEQKKKKQKFIAGCKCFAEPSWRGRYFFLDLLVLDSVFQSSCGSWIMQGVHFTSITYLMSMKLVLTRISKETQRFEPLSPKNSF